MMNTMHRRKELLNTLIVRRHTTAKELAYELGVSVRTIQYDIQALSFDFPIYTKQGENGGVFIEEGYKPYINSLTPLELKILYKLWDKSEGVDKKVIFQIICKYGPDKLQI